MNVHDAASARGRVSIYVEGMSDEITYEVGQRILLTGQPTRPMLRARGRRPPRRFRLFPRGMLNGVWRVGKVESGGVMLTVAR